MPRGIPNKKRRRKTTNGEAEAVDGAEPEVDENGNAIVAGESEEPPSLGEAIEIIRSTLAHFDDTARKRLVKAATMLLK